MDNHPEKSRNIEDLRSVFTEKNTNPIDSNDGDFDLLNNLTSLLSHSSLKREEIIRKELHLLLEENSKFMKELMKIYSVCSMTLSLDEFIENVLEKLYDNGLEREKLRLKQLNRLQIQSLNRQIDTPRPTTLEISNNSSQSFSYNMERKYEFSKQVMKVFDSNERKIFNDNPMGLHYLDPSIEPYHPLSFNNIIFNNDKTKKKADSNQSEIPLIPKKRRTNRRRKS
ncbi:predicted protein [Naegleria gruberi]|uniref:Predicted protein n=1 Tax=Naegleria gruberi TaxID=5762 RepID=D2UXV9_NAEGR|nr:uncharacterized protein NAEGRDRAFT_61258 [Naegleria gruberi]EFC50357.1 predicted protein [Naegleria gruberi]|eukprot:XP_002683101.1 predicted protein [Naegleria gruberi strain NEG-M]